MLEQYLRAGDGVIDIGANVGDYTRRYAATVGPTGCVVAVEPDPDVAAMTRHRCEGQPWIQVMQAAVTDGTGGDRVLHIDAGDSKRSSLWLENVMEGTGASKPVPTVTLDQLVAMVPALKGIKIDAQGAEGEILAGGRAALQHPDLVWAVELWPVGLRQAGSACETVIATFEAHGWTPVGQTWAEVRHVCAKQTAAHGAIDVVVTR